MRIIFEEQFCLAGHTVNNSCWSVVDDKELILLFVALFQKANNVDAVGHARHEFGDDVALNDISLCCVGKDANLSWLDIRVLSIQDIVDEIVMDCVVDSGNQFVYAFVFELVVVKA